MSATETAGAIPAWTRADRLIKARTHAGLTQAQLAERLGMSVRTVKRYEADGPYKRGLILGWALACRVDPTWLEHGNTGSDNGGVTIRYPASHLLIAAA